MRVELLPGTVNVVRFPSERRARPTMDLVRELCPDVRVVLSMADQMELEYPPDDLRESTDAETAEYILNHVPASGPERASMLQELEQSVIERAVRACREASDTWADASEAWDAYERAKKSEHPWVQSLLERASVVYEAAAQAVIEAYTRVEEAEGVARAVGFARRGKEWTPRNIQAEEDEFIASMERYGKRVEAS